jgi:hypothetical protein
MKLTLYGKDYTPVLEGARKLVALLEDPHPGLETWTAELAEADADLMMNIAEVHDCSLAVGAAVGLAAKIAMGVDLGEATDQAAASLGYIKK